MLLYLQIIFITSIIVFSFTKIRISLCLYTAYLFLIPYCSISLGGFTFSWNFINIIVLIAYLTKHYFNVQKKKIDLMPYKPLLWFYGLLLIEMLFQDFVPFSFQINSWRLDLFNLILPIIIWNESKEDPLLWKYLLYTMCAVCFIVSIYGLFLVKLDGLNPYVMLMAEINGQELLENQFGDQNSRLMNKISSVFTHPMTFGAFLGMALIYIYSYRSFIKKEILVSLIVSLLSCIFVCGIRTPIAAFFAAISIYLLLNRSLKLFFYAVILGLITFIIIIQIPAIYDTILSMVDSDSSKVGGSSIELRLLQLEAAFKEVRECMIFGKGYGFTNYYWTKYGSHPALYSFESLIFVILCNFGIVGFFIWGKLFRNLYTNSVKYFKSNKQYILLSTLFVYYLAYTIITGDYGYMKFLLLFYTLIIIIPKENLKTQFSKKNGK